MQYRWSAGDSYERYMGRWSREVAGEFVAWLAIPEGARCADIGCGTGALGATLLAGGASELLWLDRSAGYLAAAQARAQHSRAYFAVADGQALPARGGSFDAVVSGLVLNFVPQPERMLLEMTRIVRPAGVVGVYVWDYAVGMQTIREFWNAAVALDPAAAALDEGARFPLCNRPALVGLFEACGLGAVDVRAIDISARFDNFEDYWEPFLSGEGPAPGYCAALGEDRRVALRESLRSRLPAAADGTITLTARAWAVRAVRTS